MLTFSSVRLAMSMIVRRNPQVIRCISADTLVEACVHTIIRIIVICRMFEATCCIVIVLIISRWMCVSTYRKVVPGMQGLAMEIDSRYLSVSIGAEGDELFARNICIYI